MRVFTVYSVFFVKRQCKQVRLSLQFPDPPVGYGAAAMSLLHRVLSFSNDCASLYDNPNSFSFISAVFLHVVFGPPRFLFSAGVHLRAAFGIRSWGVLRTFPNHLSGPFLILRSILVHLVFCYRSLLSVHDVISMVYVARVKGHEHKYCDCY